MNFNEIQEQALKMLQLGATLPTAVAATGAPKADAAVWMQDPAFSEAADKAQALFEIRMLKRLSDDESGAGARWLLERRFPERYGAPARAGAVAAAAAEPLPVDTEADSALARAKLRRQAGAPALAIVPTPLT